MSHLRLPSPSLIVLVGPSASGKSTWATANFREGQVISSDHLRALVGRSPRDQRASDRAFALLDELVAERLEAGLLTVIDSTALDPDRRAAYRAMARDRGLPVFAVGFDVDPKVTKARNRARAHPIPMRAHDGQAKRWASVRTQLADEDFDEVFVAAQPPPIHLVPADRWAERSAAAAQAADPTPLRFEMTLARFPWDDADIGPMVAAIARRAEDVGFDTLWVMDHLRQIPQVGREWEPLPEAYTTLAYAAGITERIRLGTMVTAVTYRNVGLLAKIIATLDVLSGGRARCGIGAGWFEDEAVGFGYDWPRDGVRLDVLEDALRALPIIWGPGNKAFEGRTMSLPETMCYPRPLQEHIPILVGGGGERRTLKLVARYADASNLFGSPAEVAHKIDVLAGHCERVDRPIDDIDIGVLATALLDESPDRLRERLGRIASDGDLEGVREAVGAGLLDDQIARFRTYADVGVDSVVVGVVDLNHPDDLNPYEDLIAAFR